MAGQSTLLTKNFTAGAAVPARRIVMFGAADDTCVVAGAATDLSIGVSTELDVASGQPCDVHLAGIADVVAGGAITRGQRLTSGAAGVAVAGAAGNKIVGIALTSAVAGDIFPMLLTQSVV